MTDNELKEVCGRMNNLFYGQCDQQEKEARNKRTTHWITFQGETMCLQDWANRLGISSGALSKRLRNWPKESALTKGGVNA